MHLLPPLILPPSNTDIEFYLFSSVVGGVSPFLSLEWKGKEWQRNWAAFA